MDQDFKRIEEIQNHIEASAYSMFEGSQTLIYNEMVDLIAWKSFVGKKWAEYKRELAKLKVDAYHNLMFSQRSINYDISPSIAKDYIASKCGDMQYMVDFADRVNSNCAYGVDCLRSILSALKQEMATLNYSGSQTSS